MTVLVTRRTLLRTHLLRPDRALNNLFLYLLAVIASRYGVEVHAVVLMSTHEHLVLTDTRGVLPKFLQELHRLFALGVKVLRRWDGPVWDHEKPSVVELRTPQAVLEKIAYLMANPVTAGLVRHARQWPGVRTLPEELGRTSWTTPRPTVYLDDDNPEWPETATLALTMPALDRSHSEAREAVADELVRLEDVAQAEAQVTRRGVMGRERVKALSPYRRARSPEPLRGRNPTFAVGRGQREAFLQAVAVVREFRRAHRDALEQWRRAIRDVVFPAGTWAMHWLHGVAVRAT